MRNFDDVAPNLASLHFGEPPDVSDPTQRIADLRAAGLVNTEGDALTELGERTLEAWVEFGIDNDDIGDELARLLVMVLEGRRIGDNKIQEFLAYWTDLRANFGALDLIDNWDALYALNYMDAEQDGFSPGTAYRDARIPAAEINFDLGAYARNVRAGAQAIDGATRIENAIRGKVPRGRHRATFCMALEITIAGVGSAVPIIERFGVPLRPRSWTPFTAEQRETLLSIVEAYGLDAGGGPTRVVETGPIEAKVGDNEAAAASEMRVAIAARESDGAAALPVPDRPKLTLPDSIDFAGALVGTPPAAARTGAKPGGKAAAPRKIDYVRKARVTDEVGKLGEQFGLAYEKWRLRSHPKLAAKVEHVSVLDDSLGYDILSFETDGKPRHVEVKATLGELDRPFFLTATELEAAEALGDTYVILRVARLQTQPVCCEIRPPFDGKLILTPTAYLVEFA